MSNLLYAPRRAKPAASLNHKLFVKPWQKWFGAGLAGLRFLLAMTALPVAGVTLTWNPSPSPDIVGYYVYSGTASGIYTSKLSVSNTNSVAITNLLAGNTYYFCVTACNSAGIESEPSNEAVYAVPAAPRGTPAVLGNPSLSPNSFSFTVPVWAGKSVRVESSIDLVHWLPVLTNAAPFTFVETNTGQFAKKFFRTVNLASFSKAIPTNPPVVLASPFFSGGSFSFLIPAGGSPQVAVEVSVDLVHWVRVLTNAPPFTYVDTNASQFGERFYRAVILP